MIQGASPGVIERLFDRMTAGDWAGYGALLSPDAERIGPWGDRLVGRDRYVEMMAGPLKDGHGTMWDVHQIVYAPDGKFAFARVTANLGPGLGMPFERFDQILAFTMDDEGLVCRVEVFWQTPWLAPPGVNPRSEGNR
jgi:SnoaL-like domain